MYPIFEGYVPTFRGYVYKFREKTERSDKKYVPIKKTRVLAFPCLTFRVHIIYTKFWQIKYSRKYSMKDSRKDSMKDSRKVSMKNSKKGDYMYHTIILWVHIVSKE